MTENSEVMGTKTDTPISEGSTASCDSINISVPSGGKHAEPGKHSDNGILPHNKNPQEGSCDGECDKRLKC